MNEHIEAPFTEDQVKSLNGYQNSGCFHPFTCPTEDCRQNLTATVEGWICPKCAATQSWCHTFMANWQWLVHALIMNPQLDTKGFPQEEVAKANYVRQAASA